MEHFNLPNILTTIRIILAFVLLPFIINFQLKYVLIIMFLALLTELDGTVARKLKQVTAFGDNYDTVADGIFLYVILGALTYKGIILLHEFILLVVIEVVRLSGCIILGKKKKKLLLHSPGIMKMGGVSLAILLALAVLNVPYLRVFVWVVIGLNLAVAVERLYTGITSK